MNDLIHIVTLVVPSFFECDLVTGYNHTQLPRKKYVNAALFYALCP
jgi:hypothetical protein